MEYSCVSFTDLPDEILMIICQKLNNFDVLYCLKGVNQRIDRIVHDSTFTTRLNFVKWSKCGFISLLHCDTILDRYCLQILPDIHDKIKCLSLEASSMKHILCATDYPNLSSLALYNIDEESIRYLSTKDLIADDYYIAVVILTFFLVYIMYLCLDENLSSEIFKNQIRALGLVINRNHEGYEMFETTANIFNSIFVVFTRLTTLILSESSYKNRVRLAFNVSLFSNFHSSTLLRLFINVQCFDECLCILDGRFIHLHTLYVDLSNIHSSDEIQTQADLPNLKRFSISCNYETCDYNDTIPPLLHRMFNLEELILCLTVYQDNMFLNGNSLKKDIINHMPRLNQFSFSIESFIFINNQINLPSTEDIQCTFVDFSNNKVISYVDYFAKTGHGRCLSYTYPSLMQYYGIITNNFPGGSFINVRIVSLFDEHPFEHEFFNRIQKSFPFMESLSIKNDKPQNFKKFSGSLNDNRNFSVIEYPFLNELTLVRVHDDYIEQFLLHCKASFQDINLSINYESLQRITHGFTRDDTRINCAKINKLDLYSADKKHCNYLQEYFPCAKICYRGIF
ncbi:unnamed protein product [Adineta steineri]|uniref:F-box domain-containing protein n=1 Tax=Adineta steineri TaxID=433720 RepID=A0A814SX92_9BILA|nr:unnamed protein product [Adineta steineri]